MLSTFFDRHRGFKQPAEIDFTPAFVDTNPWELTPEFISTETKPKGTWFIVIETKDSVMKILSLSLQENNGYTSLIWKASQECQEEEVRKVQIIMTVRDLVDFTLWFEYLLPDISTGEQYKEVRDKLSIMITFKDYGENSRHFILYGILRMISMWYKIEGIWEWLEAIRKIKAIHSRDPEILSRHIEKLKEYTQLN
jgi:hypothetical protein